MLTKLLFGGASAGGFASQAALALLRIFAGVAMAFAHGIGKMPPSGRFVQVTQNLGFPAPGLFAWAAGLSEFAGGILLALGLFTRVSGFFIAFTMFVAAFVANYSKGFGEQEKAILFMLVALLFAVRGAGDWSIDSIVRRKLESAE